MIESNGIKYSYDERNNLIQVITPQSVVEYTYDSSGKRISKTCDSKSEFYVYFGINELAILDDNGFIKELRVPGLSTHKDILRPIAIETIDGIFAPIHDACGNIIRLINISNKEVITIDELDPYGIGLSENLRVSWIYSGKHYDSDADLVYFGSRFYSPQLRQWLTPDPLHQTSDPYQYCFNNPLRYSDPDGKWVIAMPLISFAWGAGATITAPIWAPYAIATAAKRGNRICRP